jgi:hypothetical protein
MYILQYYYKLVLYLFLLLSPKYHCVIRIFCEYVDYTIFTRVSTDVQIRR